MDVADLFLQPILDLLAEMIAHDEDLRIPMQGPGPVNLGNLGDMPTVGLD